MRIDVLAVIRKLHIPNKFGEYIRFDLHKVIDGKFLLKPIFYYETDSVEKAESFLKTAGWIVGEYNITKILYASGEENLPLEDVMDPLPAYTRFELTPENFKAYLKHWFFDFRKITIQFSIEYLENDKKNGFYLSLDEIDTSLMEFDDMDHYYELQRSDGFSRTTWMMKLVFGSSDLEWYYDTTIGKLIIHVPHEETTI